MLSFRQFLKESWKTFMDDVGVVVKYPKRFGVNFVGKILDPKTGKKVHGYLDAETNQTYIAVDRDEGEPIAPEYEDVRPFDKSLVKAFLFPTVRDTQAHEAAHLVQKTRQYTKYPERISSPLLGRRQNYIQGQVERDARAAEISHRIMSTYNQKLAEVLHSRPDLASTEEGRLLLKNRLRSWDYVPATAAEKSVADNEKKGLKPQPRRHRQFQKQIMAALQAAEEALPNLDTHHARAEFIRQHRPKKKP